MITYYPPFTYIHKRSYAMNPHNFHTLSIRDALELLSTSENNGLTEKEAQLRLKKYGYNRLEHKKKTPLFVRFIQQFADFMIVILILAAIVSFLVSMAKGHTDYVDPIIIFSIIILNAAIGTFQEAKAEKSLEALKKLTSPTARVIRDGMIREVPSELLVPGDIVYLESGNFVPADLRLLTSVQLKTDESALTGESRAVNKDASLSLLAQTPLAEQKNLALSTSVVTYGHGTGIVIRTGMQTEVGNIARLILEEKSPMTPLQKRLSSLGKILGITALSICGAIFVMGIMQGRSVFDMFMTSVSLAVSSIPEGLPIVVTIMLSLGVQNMAKKHAVIRHLPAVETLGSATIICSDKTGTLTQNKMTVTSICSVDGREPEDQKFARYILDLASRCCDSKVQYENGTRTVIGDSTENAIVTAALNLGMDKAKLDLTDKRISELPFDSVRKRMSVVHNGKNGYEQITKGAFDFLLPLCNYLYQNGKVIPITQSHKEKLKKINASMAKDALRVIAVAVKDVSHPKNPEEKNLTFIGFLGMIDPPRSEVKDAVATCRQAGIRPIMITGDHIVTATAIGKQLGIITSADQAITGNELNGMTDQMLADKIGTYSVYARVSPEHKVRIVKAFQNTSNIVAMTGDGVNDAPALNAADIGCAMGLTGTDVAKNSADMILTDDNFATIVAAVKEGRGIYDNIKKSIHFLLSSNIGELLTIFTAILFHLPTPLLAIHLLWINLITDSLPAIALGMEPPDKDIMKRKPLPANASIFANGLGMKIAAEGMLIGILALIAFIVGCRYFGNSSLLLGRTMCFAVLSISQLFHSFNMRSSRSLSEIGIFQNKKLVASFILCFFLQASVIMIKPLAAIFHVASLNSIQWAIVIFLSFCPIIVVEIQKKSYNKKKA